MSEVLFGENRLPYSQEMRWRTGVPVGVRFRVVERTETHTRLEAAGYGEVGAYGTGSIWVRNEHLDAARRLCDAGTFHGDREDDRRD